MTRDLEKIAKEVRKDILLMSFRAKSAHTGGALSCVEILIALYFRIMRVFPHDSESPRRDRLIFSKAHDAKALFAVLSKRGFFDKKILAGYEHNEGRLPGHSTRHCVPGVEVSAGSLGHGLPIAAGIAYAGKLKKNKYRVYAILSDGECDEGSTWEAALFSGFHRLDNLVAIIDYNKLQGYGYTKDILNLEPFGAKWSAFGWSVKEINGHDFGEIINSLRKLPFKKNKPSLLIAHTVKGLGGVPIHVNQVSSQYIPPNEKELNEALEALK